MSMPEGKLGVEEIRSGGGGITNGGGEVIDEHVSDEGLWGGRDGGVGAVGAGKEEEEGE